MPQILPPRQPLGSVASGPNGQRRHFDDEVISRFDILNLFGRPQLEKVQRTMSQATGLATVVLNYKGDPLTEMTGFTPFCRLMREGEKSRFLCRSADVYGSSQALARQKKLIYFCPCGLLEVAIPIIVKDHYLGGLYAGQVRCDDAPKDVPRLARMFESDLAACPLNSAQKKAYKNVALVEFNRFLHTSDLIALVVDQICGQVVSQQSSDREDRHELISAREEIGRLETELSLKKSEVVKLKSRLNYYFLVNALTTIANLAVIEDSHRTNEMIILMAEHLKHGLPVHKNYALLSEEVANVERYLRMQKIRYGDLLNYSLNVSRDLAMRKMPVHVVMPFVERAVFYGLATREAELNLTLTVSLDDQDVVIQVTDDGPGLSEEALAAKFASFQNGYEGEAIQMALAGARQRLTDLFGLEYEVEIKNIIGRGTESVIRFPASLPPDVL